MTDVSPANGDSPKEAAPPPLDESRFWAMIERAWKKVGGAIKARGRLIEDEFTEEDLVCVLDAMDNFIPALRGQMYVLSPEELLAFDRILERKLSDLDRPDLYERVDGTDEGFLAVRGFIVASGQACYDAVRANPYLAVPELECEELPFMVRKLYERQFGKMPRSEISRESRRNPEHWPPVG